MFLSHLYVPSHILNITDPGLLIGWQFKVSSNVEIVTVVDVLPYNTVNSCYPLFIKKVNAFLCFHTKRRYHQRKRSCGSFSGALPEFFQEQKSASAFKITKESLQHCESTQYQWCLQQSLSFGYIFHHRC
jgi:hypothetical protein